MGVWSTASHRFRTRLALAIVSATTGLASIAALFIDGHFQLMVVLSCISIGAGAAEWGLRKR
jgi:hypothetical protein